MCKASQKEKKMIGKILKGIIAKSLSLLTKNDEFRTNIVYSLFLHGLFHKMMFFKRINKTEKAIETAYFILKCTDRYINDPALQPEAREILKATQARLGLIIMKWQKEIDK